MKQTSFWQTKQGNSVKYGVSLFLPYLLFLGAIVCFSVFLFKNVIAQSVYYQLAINNAPPVSQEDATDADTKDDTYVPYLSKWATLNVEGWEKNVDIPAYFGNEEDVLKKGAAAPPYTSFCGQGGKIILSAHVTRHFAELEDTEIGTLISLETSYGSYLYKVEQKVIFDAEDATTYLTPDDKEETLVMYTCYPRENHYKPRTKRCALICKKVSGKVR